MTEKNDIVNFKEFTSWVVTLNNLEANLWTKPISEGKWSISEIVSHIMNWDNHLIAQILPSVRQGGEMIFPDFDSYNQKASDYAKSGITQSELIEQVIRTRANLVAQLLEMSDDKFNGHLNTNGVSHCPHTKEPYSLAYIIKEFILHDNQHKQQIIQFIDKEQCGISHVIVE